MTDIKDKLEAAGVETDRARLRTIGRNAIERAGENSGKALRFFRTTVLTDAHLLAELVGIPAITAAAERFLQDLRESHLYSECHSRTDLSDLSPQWPSHKNPDSQRIGDPAAAPFKGPGTSQTTIESQRRRDRPGSASQGAGARQSSCDSLSARDRPRPAPTKISPTVAAQAAKGGIWQQRIAENFDMKVGDICQYDYLNLCINNDFGTAWRKGLANVKWRDMWTPLKEFADPGEIEEIHRNAIAARDAALKAAKLTSGMVPKGIGHAN